MNAFSAPEVEAGVEALAQAFAAGRATPERVLEVYVERVATLNPALNAFVDLDIESARRAATDSGDRWRAGAPLSPIDGCVIGVKSNIAVKGLPWTAGIAAYRGRIAHEDARSVSRLRRAGAVILGTLNMEEGALGAVTDNPWFGRTINPWREGYTAGGSSGGSASAVAAGLCAAALGTDTMGSVRIPSAYCGAFGLKPAKGAIPETGVVPLSPRLDHVGVHARSARDIALIMAAVAEPEAPGDDGPLSLAVLDLTGQARLSDQTERAFAALIERAESLGLIGGAVRIDIDLGRLRRLGLLISEVEGLAEHQGALARDPGGFSPAFAGMLRWGGSQPAERVEAARVELGEARDAVSAALGSHAGLLAPVTGAPAFAFGEDIPADQADITCLANVAGLPAVAFPIGQTPGGLPSSAQIIARRSDEALALAERLASPIGAPPGFA